MQQYNIFQAIFMAFYSPNLYRDVARNWGGKTFLYLFVLVALSWILFTYQFQSALNAAYAKNSNLIVEQIPVITVKDGKISTPEKRPYLIKSPDTQEVIAIIDTSGQYTTLEQAKTGLLVTETAIISQPKENETRINQVPSNLNLQVDPMVVNSYIEKYLGFLWIFMYIFFVVLFYIYRIIQALIYAVIGIIISGFARAQLSYGQILQIAMVAVTPAIVLSTILDFFQIGFRYDMLLYFVLSMIYLTFGIIANKPTATVISPDKQV